MIKKSILTIFIFFLTLNDAYASIPEEILGKYPNSNEVTLVYPINNEIVEIECNTKVTDVFKISHTYIKERGLFYLNIYKDSQKVWSHINDGEYIIATISESGEYSWDIEHMYLKDYNPQLLEYGQIYLQKTTPEKVKIACLEEQQNNQKTEENEIPKENTKPKIPDQKKTPSEKATLIKETIKGAKVKINEVKDFFDWNTKIRNGILAGLEEIYEIAENYEPVEQEIIKENPIKPFIFPFKKIIGVTQWHGNTAFQQPHTGIDFGATKNTIIAPADGIVIAKGYDTFNGECFSGGNYLLIKHRNGMHTSYMHLEKTFVNKNDKVSKGEEIAVSGNSGKWNCQSLKYHLHFETRTGRYQSTHVNPVDYIETNWDQIVTLNAENIPARLSGENPHPTY